MIVLYMEEDGIPTPRIFHEAVYQLAWEEYYLMSMLRNYRCWIETIKEDDHHKSTGLSESSRCRRGIVR